MLPAAARRLPFFSAPKNPKNSKKVSRWCCAVSRNVARRRQVIDPSKPETLRQHLEIIAQTITGLKREV
jgi:hypothetical protein